MKKIVLLALVFLGLGSATASARPYVSGSVGIAIPGNWDETIWGSYELETGLALNAAIGSDYGPGRVEAAVGYQQHNWKSTTDEATFLTVMANGYYDVGPTDSAIRPYVMAGAGIANVDASWASDSSTSFAWQVGAGMNFRIDDDFTFDVGYRYLRPEGLESPLYANDVSWNSHNVLAGIRYEF